MNTFKFPPDMQIIPIELNLRKQKWIVFTIYRPPRNNITYFLNVLSEAIDFYSKTHDNMIIIGDFNAEPQDQGMDNFFVEHSLYNHMKEKTCFKSMNGKCIDLIISNKKYSLQNTGTVETGLSDHHHLIYTILKTHFIKLPPKKINYRDYNKFNESIFLSDLDKFLNSGNNFLEFEKIFINILNKHAPLKTKLLRANNKPHMTKELRNAIMKRTRLKNIANKSKSHIDMASYRQQRNLVVKLNRAAKNYLYNSFNPLPYNKDFWKVCKPLFSNKSDSMKERILLVDNERIISDDNDIANTFNIYFNRITETLDIPSWNSSFIPKHCDQVKNAIEKFENHPSIKCIKS